MRWRIQMAAAPWAMQALKPRYVFSAERENTATSQGRRRQLSMCQAQSGGVHHLLRGYDRWASHTMCDRVVNAQR